MRLALVLCLLSAACACALEPPSNLEDAVQDGGGTVWAYIRRESNSVYRYDGRQWAEQTAPLSADAHARVVGIAKMTDGAVACVWLLSENKLAVTRHQGGTARLLGICDGSPSSMGLPAVPLADSRNRLWITDRNARIYRVDGKGVALAHEVSPGELDSPGKARRGYNVMHAVEDGEGRVWVYSDAFASNYANIRGVLVLADGKAELHDPASTLKKDAKILAFARADDRHMWMTVSGMGLYRVDIDSFALEPIAPPTREALWRVHELFAESGDLYAVDDDSGTYRMLWRLRDGQWTRMTPGLDVSTSHGWLPRSWLAIKEGLLVESYMVGPWFVPRQGEPARFSWRAGFPLEGAHAFARFADGTFFALGRAGECFHGELSLPPHDRESPHVEAVEADDGWKLDASGRPWITLKDSPGAISEWDGEKWVAHPIPGEADQTRPSTILIDAEDRVWVNPGTGDQKVHIFDVKTGEWRNFDDIKAAFLGCRERPPHFPENGYFLFDPQYSTDASRAAYRQGVVYLHYYDGSSWRRLDRAQISGEKNDNAVGPPWFDATGNLSVNLRPGATWRMDGTGKWSKVAFQSHFPKDIWSENPNQKASTPDAPEGCVTAHPDSIVVDNLGTFWLTWQRALYKAVPGRCVKVFGDVEVNPFVSGRQLREVFVDARGNAFLLTASATMDAFIVKPKFAPPRTVLAVEPVGADSVTVRLHADGGHPVEFRWRLDDGPWQLTGDDTLALCSLPAGSHRVFVSGVDAELQTEAPPVAATFEVKIDPAQQIAGFISRLSDPDYTRRNASVTALARQPALAQPALKAARINADENQRWWIDAALQQIETTRRIMSSKHEDNPLNR